MKLSASGLISRILPYVEINERNFNVSYDYREKASLTLFMDGFGM